MEQIDIELSLNNLSDLLQEDLSLASGLIKEAKKYFNKKDVEEIIFAFKCANDYHRGQKRKSGEPYIIHPIEVATIILKEMHFIDKSLVIAALLHDVIEDTSIQKETIIELFGEDVANLVDGVSKIKDLNFTSKTEVGQYNDCKLLRNSAKDIREIALKIADRLHNMRTLVFKGSKELIDYYMSLTEKDIEKIEIEANSKQKEKSIETYVLFVPLADRIGCSLIRDEFLKLSFMYLHNTDFHRFKAYLENYQKLNEKILETISIDISDILNQHNIDHDISFKLKDYFEIYTAIRRSKLKNPDFYKLSGLITYEINVEDKKKCYEALKILETKYKIGKVEDFISVPKTNGFRAIELFVNDGAGHLICFKICSKQMKLINDYGLGSLTQRYPNKSWQEIQEDLNHNNSFVSAFQSIENLAKDNAEFLNIVRNEILSKQIEVISKDNKRYSLPRGASVLDFAYRIHSDIGDQAVNGIVNGRRTGLDYTLNDGDKVIIITNELQLYQPKDNLNIVITSTAKRKIKDGPSRVNNIKLERKLPN